LSSVVVTSKKKIEPVPLAALHKQAAQLPSGETIRIRMAMTASEQIQGLSGLMPDEFAEDEAMLFFNLDTRLRSFWMPDTYFDLDIFFLDEDLNVIDVDRKVPHHPGRQNPDSIPRAKSVTCRHVFEMKASSPLSAKLKKGDKLIWKGDYPLSQIELSIRQGL
jgi:uncharacterized membrane protein (UPF0127 family)